LCVEPEQLVKQNEHKVKYL